MIRIGDKFTNTKNGTGLNRLTPKDLNKNLLEKFLLKN